MTATHILTVENPKTTKGQKRGWLTGILYLLPADSSGLGNLCPFASAGCRAACLNTAGRGGLEQQQAARMERTRMFFQNSAAFLELLAWDIEALQRKATRERMRVAIRLNGTSDIPWEKVRGMNGLTLMQRFPRVTFYDYTKRPDRESLPKNYSLTFSRSESNETQALFALASGRNVAVVFETKRGEKLPTHWNGYRVIDGDKDDLRFLEPRGVVVGLRAKGKARRDDSGFVVITGYPMRNCA